MLASDVFTFVRFLGRIIARDSLQLLPAITPRSSSKAIIKPSADPSKTVSTSRPTIFPKVTSRPTAAE